VLRFFVQNVAQAGKIHIAVVTGGPWAEQTLSWNTAPGVAAVPAVTASIFAADEGSYVTVDITSVVQTWVNGTQANLGLALRGDSPALNMTLNSKENTGTSHPMELESATRARRQSRGPSGSAPRGRTPTPTSPVPSMPVSLRRLTYGSRPTSRR
jgi:hypothetical protein